jgi:hypothetical protein
MLARMERNSVGAPHQLPAYLHKRYLAWGAEARGILGELEDEVASIVGTGRELPAVDAAVDAKPAD